MIARLTEQPDRALRVAIWAILAITASRVVALAFSDAQLFVDEAQYWLWGQDLDFGYYSKPPMVAWVIRAFTELGQSDAPFWIRLAGPLFHAGTAFILMAIARRLHGPGVAAVTGLAYITLPLVSLGSAVISTDTILFPFLALALMFWLRLVERSSASDALLAGACLGLGFLSKYAAVYFLIGAALAAALRRDARPTLRDAALGAAAFALVILPNILWNVAHGGSTVEHTLDNASWVRDPAAEAALNFDKLGEFLGAQFLVFGPVMFGALLWSVWRAIRGRAGRAEMLMLIFALPVLALVSGQALLSRAYANWAVTAYIAGTLAVVPLLLARAPRWLAGSFVFNGVLALAVPLAMVYAESFAWDGKPVLSRVLGRVEISERIIDLAEESSAETVVAVHRDILADLFHTGRDSGLSFRAVRGDGPPEHHYEMSYPYDGQAADPVLLVLLGTTPPGCPHELAEGWTGGTGAFEGYEFRAWLVAPDCPSLGRFQVRSR